MTFWSSQTLKQKLPTLITPYDASKVEQASYTLKIGREIFITKDQHNPNSQHTKWTLTNDQAFVIPPGQFAFLLTEESVKVPNDAIAFISMKASFKYKGLVNISGFHVDPGFSGNLLFSVYNAGPSPIHLQHNLPLFLIWYASLDMVDSVPRSKQGYSEIPIQVLNQISTDEVYSVQTLTTKISRVEGQYNSVLWWIGGIKWFSGLLAAVVLSAIPFLYSNWGTISDYYEALNKLVEDQHKQSKSIANSGTTKNVESVTHSPVSK